MKPTTTQLQQYTSQALRTECVKPEILCNVEVLTYVISAVVLATQLLDQLKKNYWYGKPIDLSTWEVTVNQLKRHTEALLSNTLNVTRATAPLISNTRVAHAIIGIMTEAGELGEAFLNGAQDIVNLSEEGGDISWYLAVLFDAIGQDWGARLETNIAKLRARYPDKFDQGHAIDRDVQAERKILET